MDSTGSHPALCAHRHADTTYCDDLDRIIRGQSLSSEICNFVRNLWGRLYDRVDLVNFRSSGENSIHTDIGILSPFIAVPVARAIATRPTAILQYAGFWQKVMLYRFYGAMFGAVTGLPLVFESKSIFGACVTVATSEIVYAGLVLKAARGCRSDLELIGPSSGATQEHQFRTWTTYRHMAMFSSLGWLAGQSERVLLGAWAGTSALGIYSFGTAIGRSVGDAIGASQPGVLRADLTKAAATTDDEMRNLLGKNLRGGLLLTATNALAVIIASIYILPAIVGAQWTNSLQMAPILALSVIPAAITQLTAPVFVQKHTSHIAYIAPAVCLIFAPLVASAAIKSLTLAAWAVLLRETTLATMQSLLLGRSAPWREILAAFLVVAGGALAVAYLLSR